MVRKNGSVLRQDEYVTPFEEYWTFGRHEGRWKLKEVLPPARGQFRFGQEGTFRRKVWNEFRFQARWRSSDSVSASDATTIRVPDAFTGGGASEGYEDEKGRLSEVIGVLNERFGMNLDEADKLYFAPCLPADWKGFKVDYRYHETTYHIEVVRPQPGESQAAVITVDGTPRPVPARYAIGRFMRPPAPLATAGRHARPCGSPPLGPPP